MTLYKVRRKHSDEQEEQWRDEGLQVVRALTLKDGNEAAGLASASRLALSSDDPAQ